MRLSLCRSSRLLLAALLLLVSLPLLGQTQTPLTIYVTPGGQIPLGPLGNEGDLLYTFGGGVNLAFEYVLPFAPSAYAEGLVGYLYLPTVIEAGLNMVSLGAGMGFRKEFSPLLEARLAVLGGYALGIYPGVPLGGAGFVNVEGKLLYYFGPSFAVGLGVAYQHYFNAYNGVGVFLGASYRPRFGPSRAQIQMPPALLSPVFPIFYKYYDDNPVGTVTLKNAENGPIRDVKVSFYVPQYMEAPKECATIGEMAKDAEQEVRLFALFRDDILRITEDTKVPAQIKVRYTYLDSHLESEMTQTLRVHHRNAMSWDDTRKAASFVNAKDPLLLQFAKRITGEVRKQEAGMVNLQLREAMGLFNALKVHGTNYVVDPSSSYAANSANESEIDFLQFPVQTLLYRAGDCDDLAILYSALLEAVGIETAFLTIPGHIYVAFNSSVSADRAADEFPDALALIIRNGQVWIPVEVTLIKDGFQKAWREGAREWRENSPAGAEFYSVHDAWKTYEPVAGSDPGTSIDVPLLELVMTEYQAELGQYVGRLMDEPAKELAAQIKLSNDSPALVNRLGVLYVRYGMYREAEEQFQHAAATGYVPAMLNMGRLALLQKDSKKALEYYSAVSRAEPSNSSALVGMLKANYALENRGLVKDLYQRLVQVNPDEAKKTSYLLESSADNTRSAEAGEAHDEIWIE